MVVGISSRPSSRRRQTVACPKPAAAAASHQYSTISTAALNQLLQSPTTPHAKSSETIALPGQIFDRHFITGEQGEVHNVSSVKLPSIIRANHAGSTRELPKQARDSAIDVALSDLPAEKHRVRALTPVDEFLHNKLKSTKGCAVVTEDEAEKRLRQQAALKKQIEEKRRLQELEEQQRQQKVLEEEERVKRERAMLQQRWKKELEQERRQSRTRSASNEVGSRQDHSKRKVQGPMSKLQPLVSVLNEEPVTGETQESVWPVTAAKQEPVDSHVVPNEKRVLPAEQPTEPPSAEHARLQDNLNSLTELCERLLHEQQQMKSDLEYQRRQTMLAVQDRKLNESLREQLNTLQQHLALLTPHERAMLRIRARRRKTEALTNQQKQHTATKSSGNTETKLSKPASRKRGSWATQSKAMDPAPRESIAEVISEGDALPQDDTHGSDLELGSVTKFVYPDDSLWEPRSCASRIDGEQVPWRGLSTDEREDAEGAPRRSQPGAVRKVY